MVADISYFFNLQKLSKVQSTDGAVVDVVKRRGWHDREVQMSEGSSSQECEAGDQVTVRYNPERPLDARILPDITGILEICFGGAVFAVRKFLFAEAA